MNRKKINKDNVMEKITTFKKVSTKPDLLTVEKGGGQGLGTGINNNNDVTVSKKKFKFLTTIQKIIMGSMGEVGSYFKIETIKLDSRSYR